MPKSQQQRNKHRQYQRRRQMNTHFYDGKLKGVREHLGPYLDDIAKIDPEKKLKLFASFVSLLISRQTSTPQSQRNIQTIITDVDCPSHNYDPSNNLASEDLLYFLADLITQVDNEHQGDFLDLANQQFTEMSSGMCPQGRAYRILQVIWPALDFILKSKLE